MSFVKYDVKSKISDSISFNLIIISITENDVWGRDAVEDYYSKKLY